MLNTENKKMCYQLLQKYGSRAQMLMACVDMGEINAMAKIKLERVLKR